jgi:hypothetical protein
MKNIVLLLITLCVAFTGSAQTFEEFKKQRKQELQEMKQERSKAIEALKQEYDTYIENRDKEFANYLENEWKAFEQYKAKRLRPEPKPLKIPRFDPYVIKSVPAEDEKPEERKSDKPKEKKPEVSEKEKPEKKTPDIPLRNLEPVQTTVIDIPKTKPEQIKPVIQKSIPQDFRHDIVSFDFYGKNLAFEIDPKIRTFRVSRINEQSLSNTWSKLSGMEVSSAVHQAHAYAEDMNLNDWAIITLFEGLAADLTGSENEKNIMTWFFLNRYGYNIRIAYAGNKVSLLVPTTTELYGVKYLLIDGKKYFITTDLDSQEIYTYEAPYTLAQRDVDLHFARPLLLGDNLKEKQLAFKHDGQKYEIPVVYNHSHIKFFKDYPTTEIEVYLNAPVSEALKSSLNAALKKKVEEMSEPEAVNFLLSLSQKSFEYKTDPQQFGREKFFFPEEVFHYPFSDCEDRSAIFSYLIRELKGIDVVGLDYPGHLATAVSLPGESGSYVSVGQDRYIVADPTYVNAPFGLVMPEFAESPVKVVRIKPGEMRLARNFWKTAHEAGGYRGGNLQDYAFAADGSCYLTGYYTKGIDFDHHTLKGNGNKQAFVAHFDPDGNIQWVNGFQSKGEEAFSYANALTLVDNVPVISGVFKGNLSSGRARLSSDNNSWFVSSVDENNTRWMNKVAINDNLDNQRLVSSFSGSGRLIDTEYFAAEDVVSTMEGLSYLEGNIVLNSYLAAVPGISDKSYAAGAELDYAEMLKKTNDQLIEEDVDEAIAGLFAVTSLIQTSGYVIPGSEAQKALDRYNPDFKKRSPNIYESIGTIEFLKNSDGIVTIKSEDKHVTIDKVRIKNDARMKIVPLPDGNHRIDMLSGIQVGKYFVWYDLNYIKMFRESGDLLFDYDDDHTHKIFNLKKDILY